MTGSVKEEGTWYTASNTVKFHLQATALDSTVLADKSAEYHKVNGDLFGSASIPPSAFTGDFLLYLEGTEVAQQSGGEATIQLKDPTLTITYAAVPEPSSWSMLLGGMILTAAVVRRRRNR
jgi:hypothetical protein